MNNDILIIISILILQYALINIVYVISIINNYSKGCIIARLIGYNIENKVS